MGEFNTSHEWKSDTIIHEEKEIIDYLVVFDLTPDDLRGRILDLGSGADQKFNHGVRRIAEQRPDLDINPEIISLSPDMATGRYREYLQGSEGYEGRTIAAIGQQLPFPDESFDRVFSLGSLSVYAVYDKDAKTDPEKIKPWLAEIIRVLKPGGVAKVAGVYGEEGHAAYHQALAQSDIPASLVIVPLQDSRGIPVYTNDDKKQQIYRLEITRLL